MAVEEAVLNEATCSECVKPMGSVPSWLAGAKVKFQCEECRQKHPRIPGMVDIDPRRNAAAAEEPHDRDEVAEDTAEDEVEDEPADETDEYA